MYQLKRKALFKHRGTCRAQVSDYACPQSVDSHPPFLLCSSVSPFELHNSILDVHFPFLHIPPPHPPPPPVSFGLFYHEVSPIAWKQFHAWNSPCLQRQVSGRGCLAKMMQNIHLNDKCNPEYFISHPNSEAAATLWPSPTAPSSTSSPTRAAPSPRGCSSPPQEERWGLVKHAHKIQQ